MGSTTPTLGGRPVLAAIARAVCPPEDLGDDRVEQVAAEAERLIAALGPPAPRLLRAALVALDLATVRRRHRYRRLSALPGPDAADVLAALTHGRPGLRRPVRLVRDLVVLAYYEQPDVRAAVGYEPDPWITERRAERAERWRDDIAAHARLLEAPAPLRAPPSGGSPRRPGAIRPADQAPTGEITCDVVVVGSGAGGAVVAAELAEGGLDVVVLEEGDHHPTESFTTATTDMLRALYRDGGAAVTLGRTPIQYSEGRCVGGSTVVNGAMAFRAPERVLAAWAAGSGDRDLIRRGLDDEYSRVERFLSVGPQDPASIGRDQHLLREGAGRLGWRVIDNTRAQVHCAGCNVCTWGCPTGAKQSTLVSYLPRAVSFGAQVLPGCRVEQIQMNGKRAVGVVATTGGGPSGDGAGRLVVRARRVVVSCGAIQTPALLHRSGIRSPSGRIGRDLVVHPGAAVVALFDEPVEGWKGTHQAFQVRQFEDEGIVMAAVNLPPSLVARSLPLDGADLGEAMRSYDRIVTAGVLVEDTGRGRVRTLGRAGTPVATYRVHDRDAQQVVRGVALLSRALVAAGATAVHLPIDGLGPVHSEQDAHRLAHLPIAAERLTLSTVHLMGTAGIGVDPLTSVCDPAGAVHDTVDLFVADASLFPGPVAVNPMLTIMALATRVAGAILDGWTRR